MSEASLQHRNEKIATTSLRKVMPQDFSGKNLRGRNFKGQNLTGAKFIGADIRGANFTNAILKEADFTRAKAGLQRRWTISLVAVTFFLSAITGFASMSASWIMQYWLHSFEALKQSALVLGGIVSLVLAFCFAIVVKQGLTVGLGTWTAITIAAWSVALAGVVASPPPSGKFVPSWFDYFGAAAAALTLVLAITLLVSFAVALLVALDLALTWLLAVAMAMIFALALALAYISASADSGMQEGIVFWALAVACLGIYIMWRALAGDEKHALIRSIAIAFAATGGTSFRNADLTDANFTEATLKSTDFRTANLTRTCFRNTAKLDRARVGNSILADTRVRELLVTSNGYKKSYVGANLQGANLIGVNLNYANLKQANLSEATLHQANLQFANLTETQALATDFTAAYFTGACLEAWNIDGNTKLDRVDCRFVYLLEYPKPGTDDRERRPHHISKCFEPGDFDKLYKKIMATMQILLKDGINPEAFVAAFQKLMQDFPDITRDSIQGIEKKENDVLLTLKVPEGTDKGKIEQIWDEVYQARLEAQRQAEQLKSKDEIIAIERDHYRVFQDFVRGVFSQYLPNPSTVPQPSSLIINNHNQSTAENKVASDNIDQSRKAEISGGTVNATGAGSLSLGDHGGTTANTIEELTNSAVSAALEEDRPS
ncbi:pentapeptide repeat-containing protein [Microcoleus sp.]|uniref:pentapeptide repeat-containing protein n=1 Tax=Microcoleus sp. TaxID=44472 RepID=UPI0035241F92